MSSGSIPRYVPSQTPISSRIPLGKRTAEHAGLASSTQEPPSTARKTQAILQSDLERRLRASQQKEAELLALLEEARDEIETARDINRRLAEDDARREETEAQKSQKELETLQASQQTIHRLRSERNDLQQSNAQLSTQLTTLTHQSNSTRTSLENQVTLLTGQLEVVEEESKEWRERAEERKLEIGSLRRQVEELIEEAEKAKREEGEEKVGVVLREELHRQAKNLQNQDLAMSTMKTELVQLRQRKDDVEILQQQIKELDRAWGDKCHLAAETAERLRSDLDALASAQSSETSQTQLQTTIQLHQEALSTLSVKETEIKSLQARLESLSASSRGAISSLSTQVESLERELRLAQEGRKNAEMRAELMSKEVRILDGAVTAEGGRKASAAGVLSEGDLTDKVRRLEELLESYKEKVEGMEKDSRKLEEDVAAGKGYVRKDMFDQLSVERDTLNQQVGSLQSQLTSLPELESELFSLRDQTTSLESEISLLERRVARGEYNPETFQCLQLSINPSSQDLAIRTATLDALREENQALLGMIEGKEGESVPRVSMELLRKEKEAEKAQLEKRLLRLKEVFQAKSQEFLDTLYSLLGYRINFSPNGDVRLNTTYASKSALGFKFSSQEGHFGTMQLTGSMAKNFDELRDFWVTQRQEIPCFLASVTLELYDACTRGKAAGWVRPVDPDDE
ncbi:Mitotic checkpoint protein MAD1 [Phaffia rhodozyma]|uniref:Spindle assembly checkpoint component MAD1 n=1 Tax=Phaffia rhodozyma TaxID=264483 RepID=A0A0F7SZ32_PHARH|nr:Mitotic checkpoint protein MAD1 [Phaffia rhodozyma]